jgi:endo-1,4-beta-xylanase
MITRRRLMAGMAAVPAAALVPAFPSETKASPPSLNAAAARNGRYFGAAVRTEYMERDPRLREEIVQHCGWITPEIHLKWNSIENRRGQFWFEPVDKLMRFAAANGMQVHGHTLLWDQSTPDWAKREMRRRRDWRLVEAHFQRLMTRYASIPQWDVVNEVIDTQTGDRQGLRRNTFYKAYGPNYITQALETARRHAPDARLMLNDYSFEYENYVDADRRTTFLKLIERLRKAGTPLDGVGLQAHLDLGKGPLKKGTLGPFLRELANFDLDIVVSELDVKEHDYRASTRERDQRVADEVARYLDIVLDEPAVKGVVTWGLSDKYSWLKVERGDKVNRARYGNPAPNRGLPYDSAMQAKPMHQVLAERLANRTV